MSDKSFSDNRGQFITFTAVVLAVIIVGGMGVAYAGISGYEDRRTGVSVQDDIKQNLEDTTDMLEDSVTDINHDPTLGSLSDRKSEFEGVIDSIEQSGLTDRKYINISDSNLKYTAGTRVVSSNPTSNLSADGSQNWTVMSSADDAKQITAQIDSTTLPTASGDRPKFTIHTDAGTQEVEVYTNSAGDEIILNDTTNRLCNTTVEINSRLGGADKPVNNNVTIDLLNGVITSRTNPFIGVLRGTVGDETTHCGDYRVDSAVNGVDVTYGNATKGMLSVTFKGGTVGAGVSSSGSPPTYRESKTVATDIIYAVVLDTTVVREGTSVTHPIVISPGVNHKKPT